MKYTKQEKKIQRHARVRAKVKGTKERPRLSVFRGIKRVFVQLIDDEQGKTLCSASEHELSKADKKLSKTDRAKKLGALIAKKAQEQGISSVVFDRGGNAYHGRVRAVADVARENGLVF
ncbi:50S ribosomal protein L18 [Candidatus Uhrbacteria bacterium]|nr:50S ribosomal protein L18 [Candidatus Uhrbacteria bacterium]